MANESTPRSKLASTTHGASDNPITDRDGASVADRHGADLEPGAIVGDYQIERKIGHGGMGSVYEAIHPVIEKRVAIKVLLPQLSQNEEAVERFKSEARAVNRIRHPSIVDVFGYGTTEDGRCFLVMELLDGESLGRRLQYDPPGVAEACDILMAITHALDAAHATGIVHRDLKPDNVFLVEHKHVKLLDFGIAKLSARPDNEQASTEYTQPGQAMGTPRYIAPEQARGDAVDGRTDIYSLGVMAFELLTGRLPFIGDNAMELIAKHITLPPPTPTDIAPTLPPAADTLLLRMLDKEPANRPQLSAVRALLDEIRAPWVTSVNHPEPIAIAPVSPLTEGPRRTFARTPAALSVAAPVKRTWWIAAAIVASLCVGVGAFAVVRSNKATQDEPLPAIIVPAAPITLPPPPVVAPPVVAPPAVEVTPPKPAVEPAEPMPTPKAAPKPVKRLPPPPRTVVKPEPPIQPEVKPEKPAEPPPAIDVKRDGLMRPKVLQPKTP